MKTTPLILIIIGAAIFAQTDGRTGGAAKTQPPSHPEPRGLSDAEALRFAKLQAAIFRSQAEYAEKRAGMTECRENISLAKAQDEYAKKAEELNKMEVALRQKSGDYTAALAEQRKLSGAWDSCLINEDLLWKCGPAPTDLPKK